MFPITMVILISRFNLLKHWLTAMQPTIVVKFFLSPRKMQCLNQK